MGMSATGDDKVRQEQGFPDPASRDLEDVNTRLRQEMAQRRRAEEAHAILAAIVENSSDAIIGQKLDGTIVTWNKGAEQLFGYTIDEAVGRSAAMLAPPDLEDETTRIVQAIRRGEV